MRLNSGQLVKIQPFVLIDILTKDKINDWYGILLKVVSYKLNNEIIWESLLETGVVIHVPESWITDIIG